MLRVHDRVYTRPGTHHGAILAKPFSIVSLSMITTSKRAFTWVDHTMHPGPYPPDAGRTTVASRVPWQSRDCGYIVSELYTDCYLPALSPRVLLMEQEVPSVRSS